MANYNAAEADIGDTLYLATPYGWSNHTVTEWRVVRRTPSGQVVCKRGDSEMRLSARGHIVGQGAYSRTVFVSPERAEEMRAQLAERQRWDEISRAADDLEKAARRQDAEAATEAFNRISQGMAAKS